MAIVTPEARGGILRADKVVREVYLGGVLRRDAVVSAVKLSAGLAPTLCEVRFPRLLAHQQGTQVGATVEVWCNRESYPVPLFRGVVVMLRQDDSLGRSVSSALARDVRGALDDGVCSRNFNEVFRGRQVESLPLRAVAAAIVAECNAHQAAQGVPARYRLQLNTASLPDRSVGQFLVRGEPWSSALQRLLDEWGRGRHRLAVEYLTSASQLFAFVPGEGATQEVRRGVDRATSIAAQRFGPPNVSEIVDERNHAAVVNELLIESSDVVFEEAVALTANWPGAGTADFDALLSQAQQAQLYPVPLGIAPPSYDPTMSSVGRRYLLPDLVDLDGVTRPLEMAETLVQPQEYPGAVWLKVPDSPFLAYQDDTGRWVARWDGWSLSGREVWLDEPWYKVQRTTATRDYVVPVFQPVRHMLASVSTVYYWGYAQGLPDGVAMWDGPGETGEEYDVVDTVIELLPGSGALSAEMIWAQPTVLPASGEIAIDRARGVLIATAPLAVYVYHSTTWQRRVPWGALYLNAAWQSRTRITGSSGKQGAGALHVKRLATVEGYRKRVLRDHLKVEDSIVTVGTPLTLATLSMEEGTTVVEDDTTALDELATTRVRATQEPLRTMLRTMPRGDLGYSIGAQLVENGVVTGCNIVELTVDLDRMVTMVVASNR